MTVLLSSLCNDVEVEGRGEIKATPTPNRDVSMFKQTTSTSTSLSASLSLSSFMCLISGDSIVGAAPSPKLSPRPGRRASGPARKSRQPRPKPLCLRVCFLRDRQSSTTTLLKSSVKCHKCVLPTCNTIQPSMAAADLQSQQRRVSNNTRGT